MMLLFLAKIRTKKESMLYMQGFCSSSNVNVLRCSIVVVYIVFCLCICCVCCVGGVVIFGGCFLLGLLIFRAVIFSGWLVFYVMLFLWRDGFWWFLGLGCFWFGDGFNFWGSSFCSVSAPFSVGFCAFECCGLLFLYWGVGWFGGLVFVAFL